MSDDVFSLKGLFMTAALALAIDLLFVFPISHYSPWGQAIATKMATLWGFIPDGGASIAAGTVSTTTMAAAASTGAAATTSSAAAGAGLGQLVFDTPY